VFKLVFIHNVLQSRRLLTRNLVDELPPNREHIVENLAHRSCS